MFILYFLGETGNQDCGVHCNLRLENASLIPKSGLTKQPDLIFNIFKLASFKYKNINGKKNCKPLTLSPTNPAPPSLQAKTIVEEPKQTINSIVVGQLLIIIERTNIAIDLSSKEPVASPKNQAFH